jgi:CBS domain-containing protein
MPVTKEEAFTKLTLGAKTAADLMTPNPVSLGENETLSAALALLTDRGIKAAPVIDAAGRPVGVLSGTDLLIHNRERVNYSRVAADSDPRTGSESAADENVEGNGTRVRDVMTPAVFSVAPETLAARVIEQMAALKVHRLFVVDATGVLIGVISALDVLRRLTDRAAHKGRAAK